MVEPRLQVVGFGESLVDQHLAAARRLRQLAFAQHHVVDARRAIRAAATPGCAETGSLRPGMSSNPTPETRVSRVRTPGTCCELARDPQRCAHHAGGHVGHAATGRSSCRAPVPASRTCRWPSRTATTPQASTAATAAICIFMRPMSRSSLRSSVGEVAHHHRRSPALARVALVSMLRIMPSAKRTTRSPICGDVGVVGDQQRRGAQFLVGGHDGIQDADAGGDIQRAGGLVAQQHAWAAWRWRARSPRAAARRRRVARGSARVRLTRPTSASASRGRHGIVGHFGHQFDVLLRSEARDQVVELEHEARRCGGGRRVVSASEAVARSSSCEPRVAGGGLVEAAEDIEQRRLAGTRWSQQHDQLAFVRP